MSKSAHIFNPLNDSLEERVRSFRSVSQAFRNVESSLQHMGDKEWADRLGEKEDVQQAYDITKRSLGMATQSIQQSELKSAIAQGLINDREAREFIQIKRQQEMKNSRAQQSQVASNQHKR